MQQIIDQYKPLIDARIDELTASTVASSLPWAREVAQTLADTTKRGKTVRGSLVLAGVELFGDTVTEETISVAACIEYLHSALLIHDDVIDHDDLRRGMPSVHKAYQSLGEQRQHTDPAEFGKGMAICIGDIAIFGAFSFLSQLSFPPALSQSLMQCITQEFLLVGFGELHDIALGYQRNMPSQEEVLAMYRHKTARYTFSLPLMVGCILTDQPAAVRETTAQLGERLGLIFQLTDDQLTLTGDSAIVGKSIGNDISENKKTLYSVLLQQKIQGNDAVVLKNIFGKPNPSEQDITTINELIEQYNVRTDINNFIDTLAQEANQFISSLDLSEEKKQTLRSIEQFLRTRSK